MRFDDRLATVLSQPAAEAHDRNVRWRQLVDLVARSNGNADRVMLGKALEAIAADHASVPEPLRAAAARAIAGNAVPAALLELFAADSLAVAAPLLAGAKLEGDLLERLRKAASPEVSRFLVSIHGPAKAVPSAAEPEAKRAAPETPAPEPSISDVVAKLDRLRSARERAAPKPIPPPANGTEAVFRWECSASGEIDWVEGVPRGPLIGRSIAVADPDEGVDDCVERAFSIRAPFRDCLLELSDEGRLAGRWTISGAPAFSPADGRFVGYRGIAQRGDPAAAPVADLPRAISASPSHESLREMIHEIKTPLNAIIGFAEIIDGQYFGPAHRRYRERAAEIVTNARMLLEAANDLDFVARAQSSAEAGTPGTQFRDVFPRVAEQLATMAAKNGVSVDFDVPEDDLRCALDPDLTERLLKRFTDALVGAATPGERLVLRVSHEGRRCAISLTRPRATVLAARQDLLDPEFSIGGTDRGLLGLGFSLRLVNGLAQLAGGALEIDDERLTLVVPSA